MKRSVLALAAAGLLTSACATQGGETVSPPPRLEAAGVVMARPASSIDYGSVRIGSRELGYALGRQLVAEGADTNLVYSPTSLAIAFAMLREGAEGKTAASIDRVLHLPADRQTSYNGLVTELARPGGGNTLDIGNGLFIDPTLSVVPSYLTALKKWYGAGIYRTPFPSPALDDINAYVDTSTHGRIPHPIAKLPDGAYFALINTVYLHAAWQQPFERYATAPAPFATAAGSRVTAQMMTRSGNIDYASGPGWQAVRLPYRGDQLSMWVMLPTGAEKAIELLSPEVLASTGSRFTSRRLVLRLPKWDIGNLLDLEPTLKGMGLSDTFDGSGDYRGLTNDARFAVVQVLQQANITVAEKGTVAAAATAIIAVPESAEPAPTLTFDADHPFAFAIMDNTTGTPLFEGVVGDPSAQAG